MGGVPSKPDFERFDRPLAFGAGYSRTGTNSMQLALEKLYDGPCQHGGTNFLTREDAFGKLWCTALERKRKGQREEVLKLVREGCRGYAAITDMPAILFVPEILEVFPDVKVILVLRDPQNWWVSFGNLLDHTHAWYLPAMCCIAPGLRWVPFIVREWRYMVDQAMIRLGKQPGDYGPDIIEEYNDSVRKLVPKHQLLEMRLGDGWEPLCRFLDKPIPNEPFPRVNEADSVGKTSARCVRKLLFMWAGVFSIVGVAGYGVAKLLER